MVAGFRSTTRANTRLLKLTRAGLLKRFFVGTIGAGRKAIYSLAPSAASLVDSPLRLVRQPRGTTVFGEQFVGHQLALNQVDLAFARHQRPSLVETFRWRTVLKSVSSSLRLIPDAYTEWTAAQSGRAAFIEVDLGTETLKRWREKVRMYLQFATSGELASTFGHQRFRVLVITNSERRLNNIRRTVLRQTDKIFWFATLESINREGIWSPICFGQRVNNCSRWLEDLMRYCNFCHRVTAGEPLFCNFCGRSYDWEALVHLAIQILGTRKYAVNAVLVTCRRRSRECRFGLGLYWFCCRRCRESRCSESRFCC